MTIAETMTTRFTDEEIEAMIDDKIERIIIVAGGPGDINEEFSCSCPNVVNAPECPFS